MSRKIRGNCRDGLLLTKSHRDPLSLETEYCCFTWGIKHLKQKENMGTFHLAPGEVPHRAASHTNLEKYLGMQQSCQGVHH